MSSQVSATVHEAFQQHVVKTSLEDSLTTRHAACEGKEKSVILLIAAPNLSVKFAPLIFTS